MTETSSQAEALRLAMRCMAGSVSIVTVGTGSARTGMTVTSAISLSMTPPTMLVAVDRGSSAWPILESSGHFAINVPSAAQVGTAERFAGRGGAKGLARYVGADWYALGSGTLGLVGALAVIDCRVDEIIVRHSHAIVLGAVLSVHIEDVATAEPLVYVGGAFVPTLPANPPALAKARPQPDGRAHV